MSDDLISRKALVDSLETSKDKVYEGKTIFEVMNEIISEQETAFDKESVIEELKSWEKASHDAGIQSTYAELNNKASGYYQESRAYHRAIEVVKKGGIE